MKQITIAMLALTLATTGCDKKPEPTTTTPAAPGSVAPGGAAMPNAQQKAQHGAKPGSQPASKPASQAVSWTKPEAWKDGGQKPMRIATFKVAAAEGDSAEAEVSISRAMGSVDANVTRWRGQFKDSPEAKVVEKEVAGIKATLVEIEGTWMAGGGRPMGGGGAPQDGWKMVVAMVHTEGSAHFFKLWGPKKTVDGARGDFDGLLGSITQK
jgi:hypothetical protein